MKADAQLIEDTQQQERQKLFEDAEREQARELQLKRKQDEEKLYQELKAKERKRVLEEEQKAQDEAHRLAKKNRDEEQEKLREQQRLLELQAKAREDVRLEFMQQRKAEQQRGTLASLIANPLLTIGAGKIEPSQPTDQPKAATRAGSMTPQQKKEFISAEVQRRLLLNKHNHNQVFFKQLNDKPDINAIREQPASKEHCKVPLPSTPTTPSEQPIKRSKSEVFFTLLLSTIQVRIVRQMLLLLYPTGIKH